MVSNYDVAKKIGKIAFSSTFNFVRGLVEGNLIIPTAIRKMIENTEETGEPGVYEGGVALNCLLVPIGDVFAYMSLFRHDVKLAGMILGTHIATNLGSGLYEIFKYTKGRMESSPNPQPSNLEVKVEEPVKPEPIVETKPKKKFVNPFEVEFEE